MLTVFWILASVVAFFLLFPFITVLLSRFRPERKPPGASAYEDFGCIITAYKNAEIAKPLIVSLLKQKHPNLHVYLVADECDITGWDMTDPRLAVFCPEPSLRLKAKSIIYAMERFVRPHSYTAVFDADNLAHPDFLTICNNYAQAGHLAIQCQRTAKNINTFYAAADALGEFYKNYIDRYAPYLIGSSAVISGSGMAVETALYWDYLMGPDITAGKEKWKRMLQEDKILQNHLLKHRHERIAYAWDAVVYDEKVTSGQAVETQRARWLYSYFQNTPNSLSILLKGLFGLSWNRLIFGLVTIAPPMFIQLALAALMFVVGLVADLRMSLLLVGAGMVFVLNILWTLKLSRAPKAVWDAVWRIPGFVFRQVTALFKMANPNKNFKHSEHTVKVDIDEVLKNER